MRQIVFTVVCGERALVFAVFDVQVLAALRFTHWTALDRLLHCVSSAALV